MRTLLFITMSLASAQVMARAEIQIFVNYRGRNAYDFKVVSTPDNPVSAWYIFVPRKNGACFKGDPDQALTLMNSMVDVYNAEYGRKVQMLGRIENKSTRNYLVIDEVDEDGRVRKWFPHLRECLRWSNVYERWP